MEHQPTSRRAVLVGALALGGGALLAACGGGDDEAAAPAPTDAGTGTGTSGSAGSAVAPVADVPVGGGVVAAGIVVVQPTAGQFRAFSSTCTHQGCQVNRVADGQIQCPCHGSRFSATDGSVVQGPASQPLPEVAVAVEGDQVVRA